MNKKYISLSIVMLIAIGTLPALFANGENVIPIGRVFGDLGNGNQCYEIKLLQSESSITLISGANKIYYPPTSFNDCWYILGIEGNAECQDCLPDWRIIIKFKDVPEDVDIKLNENNELIEEFSGESVCGSVKGEFELPGFLMSYIDYVKIENEEESCPIQFSWKLYSVCPCKSKQALYPKVDIEQFSVTGGDTIIKDGKILTNFNVIPGVQQTFIQVENRGFFTQNDAKVKFLGLPQGVTVEITPNTQKIKAHNLGTYQATFTVGADVPSGTYKVAMIAYSDKGVFDTIQMDLIVP